MAEPVGITGTAAGLVSLGLQLYGEISKYLDAVESRQRDLDFARRQTTTLQQCLDAVRLATSTPKKNNATTSKTVNSCVVACEDELKALEALVTRLTGPKTQENTPSAKLRDKGRQYAFRFHRESILELEAKLSATNGVLQTALQTLGLNVSLATSEAVSGVKSTLVAIRITEDESQTKIDNLSKPISDIQTSVSRVERLVPEINARTASTSVLMAQQSEALSLTTTQISKRINESTQSILQDVSCVDKRLDRFEELLTEMVKRSAESSAVNVQVGRLVAKPADLRTMCDEFSPLGGTQDLHDTQLIADPGQHGVKPRPCLCVTRRTLRQHQRRWGPLFSHSKIRQTHHHAPECPWSQFVPSDYQQSRQFGLTIPVIRNVVRNALRISLSLKSGAGGLSIGQDLRWIATVDSRSSPVFKMATIMNYILWHIPEEKQGPLLEACCKRILWCYSEKQASPTDVNEYGLSLLSTWAEWIECSPASIYSKAYDLLATVARSSWLKKTDMANETIQAIISQGYDDTGYASRFSGLSEAFGILDNVESFPHIAEVLGFGLLSRSILKQDHDVVARVLKAYPTSVSETNRFGQLPVHIAVGVGNTHILKLLLQADEQLLNVSDNSGYYPVDYATFERLHETCRNGHLVQCSGCTILEHLLESESALYPDVLHCALHRATSLDLTPSNAVQKLVLRHLKVRRKKLEALALEQLSSSEVKHLGICPSRILDKTAGKAQQYLDAHFWPVPVSVRVYEHGSEANEDKSIYALILDVDVAEFAWNLGFKDIGTQSAGDVYQIIQSMDLAPRRTGLIGLVRYVGWLAQHGADLTSHIPTSLRQPEPEITLAHYFMLYLGWHLRDNEELPFSLPQTVSDIVFANAADECSCRCSPNGCTPLKFFLRQLLKRDDLRSLDLSAAQSLCQTVFGLIGPTCYQNEHYAGLYRAILRHLTFTALGPRHTCCWWLETCSAEESDEIQQEDWEILILMEDLIVDFENGCGCNANLISFLQEIWDPKVKSIIEERESQQLTEAEVRGAEEVGVEWKPTEVEGDPNDTGNEDYSTPARWWKVLNEITPEPGIRLPPELRF